MHNIKALTILLAEDNLDHAEIAIDTFADLNIKNRIVHVMNGEQSLNFRNRETH